MKWAGNLFDMLFGCWHSRLSFPVSVKLPERRKIAAARQTGTYVVCLDCGREFPYDWQQMRIARPSEAIPPQKTVERAA